MERRVDICVDTFECKCWLTGWQGLTLWFSKELQSFDWSSSLDIWASMNGSTLVYISGMQIPTSPLSFSLLGLQHHLPPITGNCGHCCCLHLCVSLPLPLSLQPYRGRADTWAYAVESAGWWWRLTAGWGEEGWRTLVVAAGPMCECLWNQLALQNNWPGWGNQTASVVGWILQLW